VQAVSRLKTFVNQCAEVSQITYLPKSCDYEFVGSFAGSGLRAIPYYTGVVGTVDTCRAKAEASGHGVFGLQYGGQSFTGNLNAAFGKYG
jgi:hypothetical protein